MAYFLAKTDPETYSLDDLSRDRETVWDGVSNPQAVKAIRGMKKGDRVLIYHSGGESTIVGLAEVVSSPRPDPQNPRSWVVDLRFMKSLEPPVTLAEVKSDPRFSEWALVRQGRLSTMTVPDVFVDWIRNRFPGAKI